jgi:hypothetical protein
MGLALGSLAHRIQTVLYRLGDCLRITGGILVSLAIGRTYFASFIALLEHLAATALVLRLTNSIRDG